MNEPVWLTPQMMLDVHSEQLALFGGPEGVRDLGFLESALARAENKWAYGETDMTTLAAAYVFGIAKKHPFIDGNKRAALASMLIFLGLNGIRFQVPPPSATAMILELAAGNIPEEGLGRWIRDNWPVSG